MKTITLFLVSILFVGLQSIAQVAPDKYYIQFTDKNNSPYSTDNPEEFLTQRAIDRRNAQDISIMENDIPVNTAYLQGVAAKGADLLFATRWLNGVTVYTDNPSVIDDILTLPYVESALKLEDRADRGKKAFFENESYGEAFTSGDMKSKLAPSTLEYGLALGQIDQINGIPLHDQGYQGQGMVIAVLDAGFQGAEEHPVFDSLWANGQILGNKDFVHVGGNVFTESSHGKSVLSCMGANKPGEMIGTAPKASFWLLRSEDVSYENYIEEFNWVSAAEFADSVGADVINSSLGYIDFDMPQWSHPYSDMDGNTAIATIGADLAASKGILVHNSAGNSGGNASWPWNGSPADGDSVFSIGAVDISGNRAGFSSIGPTYDGRIKPAVMALGAGTTVAYGIEGVGPGNGTSFSSPVMAGMSTCLWQAYPEKNNMEIQQAIKESASRYNNPDNLMGWGIPDFGEAWSILTTIEIKAGEGESLLQVYPNPFRETLNVEINGYLGEDARIELMGMPGHVIFSEVVELQPGKKSLSVFNKFGALVPGVYLLRVITEEGVEVKRVVKQ
ncbi:MAG: S8 family serine peptidase [Bacteroidales bacterium]|nr:S8 family serine peptidase [Bacteroidales bacterium]